MVASRTASVVEDDRSLPDEKAGYAQKEYVVDSENESREALDYSGAHEKTDPAEIKLVKRLDLFIMPTLWGTLKSFLPYSVF